ncbi:MAG: MgtC/SapB family protein [Bacteroidales bacterium]|nr:MgtC/SapB family protein [Bacteroidales bacterium]
MISVEEIVLRIVLSFIAGLIIGFERGRHRELISMRPHALISLGSGLLMLISMYVPWVFGMDNHFDPSRIAAQVVSGVGFIGAGAIIKLGVNVKGLTTASTIWVASAIGLAIGAGYYLAAFIALLVVLFILLFIDSIEKILFQEKIFKELLIEYEGNFKNKEKLHAILKSRKIQFFTVNFKKNFQTGTSIIIFNVTIPSLLDVENLIENITSLFQEEGLIVHEISLQNLN